MSEDEFMEYWKIMPWPAFRLKTDDIGFWVRNKYKIFGVPTLVVYDNMGNEISRPDRNLVDSEPQGFPWKSSVKTFWEEMEGQIIDNAGNSVSLDALQSLTTIGFYFSSYSSTDCRKFTPDLKKTYNIIKSSGKNFEIIFCSKDENEKDWKDQFAEMPWLSLPFQDPRISFLYEKFDVKSIPSLIIFDPQNVKTITNKGKQEVSADPNGIRFPWGPEPCSHQDGDRGIGTYLGDTACFIYFDTSSNKESIDALKSVAENAWNQWKIENVDPPLMFFLWNWCWP